MSKVAHQLNHCFEELLETTHAFGGRALLLYNPRRQQHWLKTVPLTSLCFLCLYFGAPFHSCVLDFKKTSWLIMHGLHFGNLAFGILAGFNTQKLWKKLRSSHLLILLYVLGRQWFSNKHRIPFSEFKVTNNPWYKHVACKGVSLQLPE